MADLFGHEVRPVETNGSVTVALIVHRESAKAWLLSEDGREADAVWR